MKTARICTNGNRYYKSSDCPTCPHCEKERVPTKGFLATLSAPARRALEGKGISTEKQLARYTEAEILALHGIGPSSLPKLKKALRAFDLEFKQPW
ncbi:MAG: RNA polymerase alpha subunit C-terminal domain-containing protein [Flavobacteriales bacterium]|nr:RNA polymerase alpha subunit C-terminal domain-containing protein [Flavobacteriales bacterium]